MTRKIPGRNIPTSPLGNELGFVQEIAWRRTNDT